MFLTVSWNRISNSVVSEDWVSEEKHMISELCASGRDRIFLPHLQRTEKQQQQYCTGKSCALFHFPPLCRHTKSRVVRLVHCVFFIRKKLKPNQCLYTCKHSSWKSLCILAGSGWMGWRVSHKCTRSRKQNIYTMLLVSKQHRRL